jgi:hypothetical protein
MQWMLITVLVLIAVFVAVQLWWRYASRRRNIPFPSCLSWLLTNPLRPGVGSAIILDRLDLKPGMRVVAYPIHGCDDDLVGTNTPAICWESS